jgi:hypothetical protein
MSSLGARILVGVERAQRSGEQRLSSTVANCHSGFCEDDGELFSAVGDEREAASATVPAPRTKGDYAAPTVMSESAMSYRVQRDDVDTPR